MPKIIPAASAFRDTRSMSQKIEEKRTEITHDYLSSPNKRGLVEELAIKYDFPRPDLSLKISKWGLSKQRDLVQISSDAIPVSKSLINKVTRERALVSIKKFEEVVAEHINGHLVHMHNHMSQIHEHIIQHAEDKPMDLDDRLRYIDQVDKIARRVYGMKNEEEVDPSKRGIALLAYGFQPQALAQNNTYESLPLAQGREVEPSWAQEEKEASQESEDEYSNPE